MAKGQFGDKKKIAAKKRKAEEESSSEDNKEESSESELEESDEDEGDFVLDGLSSVISKIVNQNVKKDIPVLEKRKVTNVQREEALHKESEDAQSQPSKKKSKASKELSMMTPEDLQAEQEKALTLLIKERNLKKIATKGVIALFNAIMESKRQAEGEDDNMETDRTARASSDKTNINAEVKSLTKSKFLELIAGNEDGSKKPASNSVSSQLKTATSDKEDEETSKVEPKKGWDVLRDDDDARQNTDLMLRDWDKSDDEAED